MRSKRPSAANRQGPRAFHAFRSGLRTLCNETGTALGRAIGRVPSPRRRSVAYGGLALEALEARELLSANPIINEFLARNDGGYPDDEGRDGDGGSPDWIEILNAGDESVDLAGYALTNDATNLHKWVFPSVDLDPGQYLLVFASGQSDPNYVDAGGYLHTNFTLRRSGDYLALTDPSGVKRSEFGSADAPFPEQLTNVSYGGAQSFTVFDTSIPTRYWQPLNDSVDSTWTDPDFDAEAHGFAVGTGALGFETRPNDGANFTGLIDTEVPDSVHALYVRYEFDLNSAAAISDLTMQLNYDNAYVAYLNGVKVAEDSAPALLGWFSQATGRGRSDRDIVEGPIEISLSEHRDALRDGTNVLAIHVMNDIADRDDLLLTAALYAGASDLEAATGEAARVGYLTTPTPGKANGRNDAVFSGFVEDTRFDVDRGFYTEPFQLQITTDTLDAVIRYTTDGSTPTADYGTVYSGPITISTTTPLRAAAFKEGFLPTNVDTQTYIFVNDVVNQGNTPDGYPTQWGLGIGPAVPADYEMDPEITQNPAYRDIMDDALLQIPSVSIVTDIANLFDPEIGIYQNAEAEGVQWERPASVELIYPDGTVGFQEDAGLRIQGGASRLTTRSPKHSFRLLFKSEYGNSKLQHRWFTEDTAVDQFDTIILRAGFNQSWIHHNTFLGDNRGRAQYVRDQWAKDTQRAMGYAAPHNTYAHLYINGMYWGLYNPTERPTDDFAASYFGGEKDEYDVYNSGELLDGTPDAWNRLWEEAEDDLSDPAEYAELAQILDIEAYIDYMIINHYGGNADWDDHNWYATRRRTDDGKWYFYMWDSEFLFIGLNDDATNTSDGPRYPARLLRYLSANDEFRMLYADHLQRHLFNDGVLTVDNVVDRWEARSSQITDAIVGESARWGDYRRDVENTLGGQPQVLLERDVQWVTERNRLLNEYFPYRGDVVLEQYRNDDLFPSIAAPELNQHGGVVSRNLPIRLTADLGTIYFTTDGTDPRLPGGAVAPGASTFDASFTITGDTTVKARALHDGEWSALTEADFTPASEFPLRITEINYHPYDANSVPGASDAAADDDRFEFLELMNVGNQPINLAGVQLTRSTVRGDEQGIAFQFAAQELAAGQRTVIVRDREAFQSRYGTSIPIAAGNDGAEGTDGEFGGRLSNEGEQLTLADASGQLIQQFAYRITGDWPARANGLGSTLEIVNPTGSVTDPANWRSSVDFGGSPGRGGAAAPTIVINEVLANTAGPDTDMVELFNHGRQDVDVNHWYVSDSSDDYFKRQIASSKTVPAAGYQVLTQSDLGFDLDGINGGELLLISADASGRPLQFADQIQFGLADRDVSLGPWPTRSDPFIPLNETTLGGPNAGPAIGDVIISELYFNPLDPDGAGTIQARNLEFLELTNVSDAPIDLTGWQLAGEVEYAVPDSTTLGAGESMVVVGFDPTSTSGRNNANVFKFTLGLGFTEPLYGRLLDPALGNRTRDALKDEGALVQLVRPGVPPADDPSAIPLVVVDQVSYLPEAPWPEGTAATGQSLTRTSPQDYGPLPTSWLAATPSPGSATFRERLVGDSNNDGAFDQLDITLVAQGGKYLTGEAATWSEGDWTGDGLFDEMDIVAALQMGHYLAGAQASLRATSASAVDAVFQHE